MVNLQTGIKRYILESAANGGRSTGIKNPVPVTGIKRGFETGIKDPQTGIK
jgi:hypothetical protein